MKKKKSPHPTWATEHRKPGTELRLIGNKYYLYEVKSKWNPDKKRSVKITGKIVGRITKESGLTSSHKETLRQLADNPFAHYVVTQYEYGASKFVLQIAQDWITYLQQHFKEDYQQLFSIAFLRLVYQCPIKNMPLHFHYSYLKEYFQEISISDKSISLLLRKAGQNRSAIVQLMKQFIKQDDMVLVDMTDVISYSQKMDLPHKGYNSRMDFNPQMNLLFIFSLKQQLPAYYRMVPGNIRDVKAFALSVKESGLEKVVVIADKGFYSKENVKLLDEEQLQYLIPLKRNNSLIDYAPTLAANKKLWHGYFKFEERFIWYYTTEHDGHLLHLYLDEELRVNEQRDYLNRIEKFPDTFSNEEFDLKQNTFGTIAIFNQIDKKTAKEVYTFYKSRNSIEVMFDSYKNTLAADRTYMQNEFALEGWLFINYLAMQWYYLIYFKLKELKLLKHFSVQDILIQLRQLKKIRIKNNWKITEHTRATAKLIQKLNIPIT